MKSKPRKVLIIGSGPIVIGQAAEFDYSGTQACRALAEEGIESVLLNSNPATIMTDQDMADHIYIEPITVATVEKILKIERPQGILGTLGGQTGLNLVMELHEKGIPEKYGAEILGISPDTISVAEDRDKFREFLKSIGEPYLPSAPVDNVDEALIVAERLRYPVVVRPAYTLGGTGGGFAHNPDQLRDIASNGLAMSPISQVLIEKSIKHWKEVEYEVIRDAAGNMVTVCNMENLDPLGVHTGDSIVVAPSQTLSDKEYHLLRDASLTIVDKLELKGGCNVQLALRPHRAVLDTSDIDEDYFVIEVNPRVSRSSALASKVTGYPIARVATKIALGYTLPEIPNTVTDKVTAAMEPVLDYCVVKLPRLPFDKFPHANRTLGTQMKATGEVMAIDRTFEAALQKAVRGLEYGIDSLSWEDASWGAAERSDMTADDTRLWRVVAAIRYGTPLEQVIRESGIDPWFIYAIKRIVDMEQVIRDSEMGYDMTLRAKRMGFSDAHIAKLRGSLPDRVRQARLSHGIRPVYKMVDTCAGEFEAVTPYFYSTYEEETEVTPLPSLGAVVLGSGPIRIAQGIEFDYSSVQASKALREQGVPSIIINCNPETFSTDFDSSTRLYFEPLDEESVRDIVDNEVGADGRYPKLLVQFGGQTAINLSQTLANYAEIDIIGSSPEVTDNTSDRGKFEEIAIKSGIPLPPGSVARDLAESLSIAESIGYPILIRPSYVLGGRAMVILNTRDELENYYSLIKDTPVSGGPLLIDKYLSGIEIEIDAVSDGENVLIPGVMEHIERAGVHSGDSVVIYPEQRLTATQVDKIVSYTGEIARAFGITGLMNIQYVIPRVDGKISDDVYVIEVNPRASRTIPFISKATDIPMVSIAVGVMLGKSIAEQGYAPGLQAAQGLVAVKVPVFSTWKLYGADTYLGPEMKSTGEVMGIDYEPVAAIKKGFLASYTSLPAVSGSVLISLADKDKEEARPVIEKLHQSDYQIFATEGTAKLIEAMGIPVQVVPKRLHNTDWNVLSVIRENRVDMVINTVTGDRRIIQDGFLIRRASVERRIPCFTSLDTAQLVLDTCMRDSGDTEYDVSRISNYLAGRQNGDVNQV